MQVLSSKHQSPRLSFKFTLNRSFGSLFYFRFARKGVNVAGEIIDEAS